MGDYVYSCGHYGRENLDSCRAGVAAVNADRHKKETTTAGQTLEAA